MTRVAQNAHGRAWMRLRGDQERYREREEGKESRDIIAMACESSQEERVGLRGGRRPAECRGETWRVLGTVVMAKYPCHLDMLLSCLPPWDDDDDDDDDVTKFDLYWIPFKDKYD